MASHIRRQEADRQGIPVVGVPPMVPQLLPVHVDHGPGPHVVVDHGPAVQGRVPRSQHQDRRSEGRHEDPAQAPQPQDAALPAAGELVGPGHKALIAAVLRGAPHAARHGAARADHADGIGVGEVPGVAAPAVPHAAEAAQLPVVHRLQEPAGIWTIPLGDAASGPASGILRVREWRRETRHGPVRRVEGSRPGAGWKAEALNRHHSKT
mmetsp:Transcript_121757/g.355790  ORF Transcript_121757/g.355790 Transcript_121757/m.355790 type:complete len:209 (-) Transcript_121757:126-752(-)